MQPKITFLFPSLPDQEKSLHTDHHRSEGWGGDILRELPAVFSGHHLLLLHIRHFGNGIIFPLSGIRKYNQLKVQSTIKRYIFLVSSMDKDTPEK